MSKFELLSHEDFTNKYLDNQDEYYTVCIGTRNVDLDKIIASEIAPEDVLDDENMMKMRTSIIENGWTESENEDFSDICLTLAPNGKYSISNGIRRFIIAKEMGMEKFRATIEVAVPNKYLDRSDFREIGLVEAHMDELKEKIQGIITQYNDNPDIPKSATNLINVYRNMCDRQKKKMDVIYQDVALREGLVPRFYFENRNITI